MTGMRILYALQDAIAEAIAGVISPKREFAITMPMGPIIRSASWELTMAGFSPVAP